jgi:hypothetical protein
MEIYPKNTSHSCNNKSSEKKDSNVSLLEKTLDLLYDNSQGNLNKHGDVSNNGNDKNIGNSGNSNNLNNLPRGTILLPK